MIRSDSLSLQRKCLCSEGKYSFCNGLSHVLLETALYEASTSPLDANMIVLGFSCYFEMVKFYRILEKTKNPGWNNTCLTLGDSFH